MREGTEWRILGASVPSATKTANGRTNQDAIRWAPEAGTASCVALAVSDGHGSPASFRSDLGARFAVDLATEEMMAFFPRYQGMSASEIDDAVRVRLPAAIVRRWQEKARSHLRGSPFTDQELAAVASRVGEGAGALDGRPLEAYGATLICAAVAPTFLCLLQIGDGDAVVVYEDGRVARPVPADPRLIANVTTSLCADEAAADVRVAWLDFSGGPVPELVLLSSDGYFNSFRNGEAFLQSATDLLRSLRTEGFDKLQESLPAWLTGISREGSGDDVTLGLIKRQRVDDLDAILKRLDRCEQEIGVFRSRPGPAGGQETPAADWERRFALLDNRMNRLQWVGVCGLLLSACAAGGAALATAWLRATAQSQPTRAKDQKGRNVE